MTFGVQHFINRTTFRQLNLILAWQKCVGRVSISTQVPVGKTSPGAEKTRRGSQWIAVTKVRLTSCKDVVQEWVKIDEQAYKGKHFLFLCPFPFSTQKTLHGHIWRHLVKHTLLTVAVVSKHTCAKRSKESLRWHQNVTSPYGKCHGDSNVLLCMPEGGGWSHVSSFSCEPIVEEDMLPGTSQDNC